MMPLVLGAVLQSRYRIEELLGQGGMGAVYRAWDQSLEIPVAIKENLDASPQARRQFEHEARILARLSHPNLPRVTDHFFIPGQGQYLVMDFVEGEDLGSMLRLLDVLPEPQVLRWISQICDALAYLHSQSSPVVHRDIKPANIKIRPDGKAMLVDFGIAKVYDPLLSTTMGAKAVTPGYSPPEQYGDGRTDPRSDIYALGATLYHLLTGKVPPDSIQRSAGQVLLSPPREVNPRLSPMVEDAILKAVEVTTERRFQNVDEFRGSLTQPVDETQVMAPPVSKPQDRVSDASDSLVNGRKTTSLAIIGGVVALVTVVGCVTGGLLLGPRVAPLLLGSLAPSRLSTTTAGTREVSDVGTQSTSEPLPTYTLYPTWTPYPTPTAEVEIMAPTQALKTEQLNAVGVRLCTGPDFDGLTCRSTRSIFPSDTEAVYATWRLADALMKRARFTRRWYKDGEMIVESSHVAGDNARWTPSDGASYYVYLSAVEGTGKRLWNLPFMPAGTYRFELLVDGSLVAEVDFAVQ